MSLAKPKVLFLSTVWLLLIAGLFWLHAGDLAPIDWFLLSELVAVAAAYWLFCLLAVAIDQRLSSANPLRTRPNSRASLISPAGKLGD